MASMVQRVLEEVDDGYDIYINESDEQEQEEAVVQANNQATAVPVTVIQAVFLRSNSNRNRIFERVVGCVSIAMSLTNGVHLLAPEDRQHLQPQYSTSSSLSPSQSENSSSDQLMENLQRLFDSQKKSGKEESSESDTEEMPSTSVIKPDENNKTTIPFMLQPDTKFSSLKSTRILDQLISCFVVGGECRLCFPQLAALVLGEVPQRYIDETKSNAERLIASCLSTGTAAPILDETKEDMESIQIAHDCFGGCSGRLFNALSPGPCIECSDCKNLFIPESFCRHSHSETAKKLMCHWGFDSSNWPYYLHLDNSLEVRNNAEENFLNFVQNYRQHLANVSN